MERYRVLLFSQYFENLEIKANKIVLKFLRANVMSLFLSHHQIIHYGRTMTMVSGYRLRRTQSRSSTTSLLRTDWECGLLHSVPVHSVITDFRKMYIISEVSSILFGVVFFYLTSEESSVNFNMPTLMKTILKIG